MANIVLVSRILLLIDEPLGELAKSEKLRKYCSYCTSNRVIANAYSNIIICI